MLVVENLKFILSFGGWLGVLPRYQPETGEFASVRSRSYTIILVLVATCIHALYGKWTIRFFNARNTLMVLLSLSTILLTVTNIVTLLGSCHWNLGRTRLIFKAFESIDRKFANFGVKNEFVINYIGAKLGIVSLYLTIVLIMDIKTFYTAYDVSYYQYLFQDQIQIYFIFIVVTYKTNILKHLKWRIRVFNGLIEDFQGNPAEELVELNEILCDLADTIDKNFGWHTFTSSYHILCNILVYIDLLLNQKFVWSLGVTFVAIGWCSYQIAQGVFVATMCEQVSNEGKKTITIAYKALNRYSNVASLREKLFILAQQATARCPKFTAAGFFSVDFSMLFTFVNLITTYVIVIIQFSNPKL